VIGESWTEQETRRKKSKKYISVSIPLISSSTFFSTKDFSDEDVLGIVDTHIQKSKISIQLYGGTHTEYETNDFGDGDHLATSNTYPVERSNSLSVEFFLSEGGDLKFTHSSYYSPFDSVDQLLSNMAERLAKDPCFGQ
jgi:hypothetical protein